MSYEVHVLKCNFCEGTGIRSTIGPCPWCKGIGSVEFEAVIWGHTLESRRIEVPDCPECGKELTPHRKGGTLIKWYCLACQNYRHEFDTGTPLQKTKYYTTCLTCNKSFIITCIDDEDPMQNQYTCPHCRSAGLWLPTSKKTGIYLSGVLLKIVEPESWWPDDIIRGRA